MTQLQHMRLRWRVFVLLWGTAWCTEAAAASQPVYLRPGPGGIPWLTNDDAHGRARLVLAADTAEVESFRSRYRFAGSAGARTSSTSLHSAPRRTVSPYLVAMVDAAAARAGLNADLVRAVVLVESGFQAEARSATGAIGLMQLLPSTAARFGVPDPRAAGSNLEAGTRYLAYLLHLFDGDVRLALAGYNAGEGAVLKHGLRVPPFAETQAYVPAVLSAWRNFAARRTAPEANTSDEVRALR